MVYQQIKRRKRENKNRTRIKKYENSPIRNLYRVYSEKYGISFIMQYNPKDKEKDSETDNEINEKTKNNLESILEEIEENFEEKEKYLNNQKISLLENIIKSKKEKYIAPKNYKEKDKKIIYPNFLRYKSSRRHTNSRSSAQVFYVDPSALPANVLGLYHIPTHTIYIVNNLSKDAEEFVYYHEEYHSLYGAGEDQADAYAAARTGFNLRATG